MRQQTASSWRWIDPVRLTQRIDAASQPEARSGRFDPGTMDMVSRIDRVSSKPVVASRQLTREEEINDLVSRGYLPESFREKTQ